MTPMYDRPARELIQDAIAQMPDTFESQDVVQWFKRNYPGLSPKTVRHNLRCAAVNHQSGAHWRDEERTVYRIGQGRFSRRPVGAS